MKAPLPEVPTLVPRKRDFAKVPPRTLTVICALQALFAVLSLPFGTPIPELSQFWNWTLQGIVTALGLALTYYLWLGYGWARGVWLWLSVLFLPVYFFPDETLQLSRVQQIIDYLSLGSGLFMLVYLNLPGVKGHFARRQTSDEALQ